MTTRICRRILLEKVIETPLMFKFLTKVEVVIPAKAGIHI